MIKLTNISKKFFVKKNARNSLTTENIPGIFNVLPIKKFGALKNINLEVSPGEFLGIVGRNGSGKSALLKILAGVYLPDDGSIKINGTVASLLELGAGFQGELTGRENVFLNGVLFGLGKKSIEKKFDDIVSFAEAQNYINLKVKYYSSGMLMRLAFAIAIQTDADIILLDEVLAVGDATFQQKCFRAIRGLLERKKTIILVSHDHVALRKHCHRVLYLESGMVRMIGDTKHVLENYLGDLNQEFIRSNVVIQGSGKNLKPLCIQGVEFVDKSGKNSNLFYTGDKMEVKIYIKADVCLASPNIGVMFYDSFDNYIFGTNTAIKQQTIKDLVIGENIYHFLVSSLLLLEGKYTISVALADYATTICYDWKENLGTFFVKQSSGDVGIVQLECRFLENQVTTEITPHL